MWDSEYPWDVRAEKVMRSLTEAGHDVHLAARNRRGDPLREELPEATVHRLTPWSALGSKVDGMSQFPAFMNPRWVGLLRRVGKECGAEVILVRDLPLAPTAVGVGRMLGIPVVLDMAENYAAMMRDIWTSGRQQPFDWVVRNPGIVSKIERWSLANLDHVIVVVEESGERLVEAGLDSDRVTVVCNTPLPERIPSPELLENRSEGAPLRLVYLGLLEKPRGIDEVLDGLAELRSEGLDFFLDIIGGGMEEESFVSKAERLGLLGDRVKFHGVLPYEEALAIFRKSHIGVVPHHAVESWNTTIPNKLFDYMSHALPVITSDAKPAARVVREERSGEVFRSGDSADFARAVRALVDPGTRSEIGERGRNAVVDRYNWGADQQRLLDALALTVQRGPRSGSKTRG